MSEYQYYEFRAIDRPLTAEEQRAIGKLSSRVNLSPVHASFVYNYGDFPGRAEDVLTRYFDAMFYIANWGSRQLMFRFPKTAVDLEQIQPYFQPPVVVEEFMSLTQQGEYVVLNIAWYEEEADWGWVEGEGWLPRLMSLRDEILQADYRLLYLAWLNAITLEPEVLDTVEEPPVPPGLRRLSTGLQAFIERFDLDEHLVAAAAEASGSPDTISEAQLRQAINRLSPQDQAAWLLRLAQGQEPQLAVAFNRELLTRLDRPQAAPPARRTIGELLAAAERIEKAVSAQRAAEAQAQHLKKMEALAAREGQLWQEVIDLIKQKKSNAYDQAVAHLQDLRDLAQHQGEEVAFQSRLNRIYRDYRSLSALRQRLRSAKLDEM
ncbi:MAG: hypothetical protein KDI79_09460 [Anaerolineae bacterium]|nr:hypothetical protein [Anaerolineae bacterium]